MTTRTLDGKEQRDAMRQAGAPLCLTCKRLNVGDDTCEAFPDGIPGDIYLRGFDHRKLFPGDDGIRYLKLTKGQ